MAPNYDSVININDNKGNWCFFLQELSGQGHQVIQITLKNQ